MFVDHLTRTLPVFEDEMREDPLVNQWLEVEQNCWLKNNISKYEGGP